MYHEIIWKNTIPNCYAYFIFDIDLPEASGEENKGTGLVPNFERPDWRLRVGERWLVESGMPG